MHVTTNIKIQNISIPPKSPCVTLPYLNLFNKIAGNRKKNTGDLYIAIGSRVKIQYKMRNKHLLSIHFDPHAVAKENNNR